MNPKLSAPDIPTLRAKAELGDAESQEWLGGCYYDGRGVDQDYAEAMKWFRKAADQGYGSGIYGVGVLYGYGLGVPQDYAEAAKWYLKAAARGYWAINNKDHGIAVLFKTGQGVPQDWVEAYFWYCVAIELGDEINYAFVAEAGSHLTAEQKAAAEKRAAEWMPEGKLEEALREQ